jgi:hypothetical protein
MGGSFESGAGDDPNNPFTSDEEEIEETEEGRFEQAQESDSEPVTSMKSDSNGSTGANSASGRTGETGEATDTDAGIMLYVESETESTQRDWLVSSSLILTKRPTPGHSDAMA